MEDREDEAQMERQVQRSSHFENPSVRIKMALAEMAICRGAALEKEHLLLYSRRLDRENLEDVLTTLNKIQEMPRREGELALPELGAILELVRFEGNARTRRERARTPSMLVAWKCPVCRATMNNWVPPNSDLDRICRCGKLMDAIDVAEV